MLKFFIKWIVFEIFEQIFFVVIYQMLSAMHNIYKNERICRMWIGLRPIVVLFTPESVEVFDFEIYFSFRLLWACYTA